MKFTLENRNNKTVLKLELSKTKKNPITRVTENRTVVTDVDAINYLTNCGINVGVMIKSGRNDNLEPPYVSEWEFEKYKEKPHKKQENINFSLDNSDKSVVSLPKRKSRKKSTISEDLEE
jgi:hypothetical protein